LKTSAARIGDPWPLTGLGGSSRNAEIGRKALDLKSGKKTAQKGVGPSKTKRVSKKMVVDIPRTRLCWKKGVCRSHSKRPTVRYFHKDHWSDKTLRGVVILAVGRSKVQRNALEPKRTTYLSKRRDGRKKEERQYPFRQVVRGRMMESPAGGKKQQRVTGKGFKGKPCLFWGKNRPFGCLPGRGQRCAPLLKEKVGIEQKNPSGKKGASWGISKNQAVGLCGFTRENVFSKARIRDYTRSQARTKV